MSHSGLQVIETLNSGDGGRRGCALCPGLLPLRCRIETRHVSESILLLLLDRDRAAAVHHRRSGRGR
jgi:hypothetical protein